MKRDDLPASLVQPEGYQRTTTHRAYGYRRQLDPKFGSQQAEDGTVPGVTQETQGHFLDLSSMAVLSSSKGRCSLGKLGPKIGPQNPKPERTGNCFPVDSSTIFFVARSPEVVINLTDGTLQNMSSNALNRII